MTLMTWAAQQAPPTQWWQGAWLGNVITALATIAGIGLTQYLANRRDVRYRWIEKKHAAYSMYARCAREAIDYIERLDAASVLPEEFMSKYASDDLSGALNEIRLLASQQVYGLCVETSQAIRLMAEIGTAMLREFVPDSIEERRLRLETIRARMKEDSVAARRALENFLEEARADLGADMIWKD